MLLFISCNTIALLINVFESSLSAVLGWRINYIIDISNFLVVFNSSFNFIIYYNFSRAFRTTFRHHCCLAAAVSSTAALKSPHGGKLSMAQAARLTFRRKFPSFSASAATTTTNTGA